MKAKLKTLPLLQFIAIVAVADAWSSLGTVTEPPVGGAPAITSTYYEDDTPRTWAESKKFCVSHGSAFKLAKITAAVNDVLKKAPISGTHWVDAIARVPPESMRYEDTSGIVPIPLVDWRPPLQDLCGGYYADKTAPYFRVLACELRYKVLCAQLN